jgi:hypothetical protein
MVAVVVALAVPVSQLRTVAIHHSCCCPNPDNCHCPDHKPDASGKTQIRACHSTTQIIVAPQAPAFMEPVLAMADAPARTLEAATHVMTDPHDAPPPRRPDAPS